MKTLKPIGMVAALLLPLLSAFADDVITNIMSPIASYQYPENFNPAALTSGGVMSPVASYQYFEWAGNGVLTLQSSPVASYYYQFLAVDVPSMLQAKARIGTVILSWPLSWPFSTQNFSLQTTTNLADPGSWLTLTNVPAMVNLQNTITNQMIGSQGFYRLIPSQ